MAPGPQNAVAGDTFGTDLPKAEPDTTDLAEEKNLAKFSKTKEYQKLKEYMEARIEFFQTYLPDGKEVRWQATDKLANQWVVANNVINEFKAVINLYEGVREAVDARQDK